MGKQFGGAAGAAAIAAALALVLWVAIGGHGVDYENDTYTFTDPGTTYADDKLVLVRDGAVTDVWISDADRKAENYGYTPSTPADMYFDDLSTTAKRSANGEVTLCVAYSESGQDCSTFEDIHRVSAARAQRMSSWAGLADGNYTIETRSVTWELGDSHRVEVEDGVVQNASSASVDLPALDTKEWSQLGSNWVLYWSDGADEPFAACFDQTNAYDEEWCITWSAR